MISLALCDDNPLELSATVDLLEIYQCQSGRELHYTCFANGQELLCHPQCADFDVYLLDVLMPGFNGIELAKELRSTGIHGIIIFLTSSRDFALEAFQVRAFSYLLKPVAQQALFSLLDDYVERQPVPKSITVALSSGSYCCIPLNKLIYVEHEKHVCIYHMSTGEVIRGKTIRVSFPAAMEGLLGDERFIMPHQSFVVNMQYVFQMNSTEFLLKDHTIIPISRQRTSQVKIKYLAYLSSLAIP